jgi:hypothetical protein
MLENTHCNIKKVQHMLLDFFLEKGIFRIGLVSFTIATQLFSGLNILTE